MRDDQVNIKFGPARYDSPKAVRRAIDSSAKETTEVILNNPDVTGGGTAVPLTEEATILTYVPSTNSGTCTVISSGATVAFTNGVAQYLGIGDTVVISQTSDGTWVVIAIISRSGATTPVSQPIPVLPSNFPLITSTLPNPIFVSRTSGLGKSIGYDIAGTYGQGSNTIFGRGGFDESPGGVVVDGYSLDASSSSSNITVPIGSFGFTPNTFVTKDGRLYASYQAASTTTSWYMKKLLTGSVNVNYLTTVTTSAHDTLYGNVWHATSATNLFKQLHNDSSVTASSNTRTSGSALWAENGYLIETTTSIVRIKLSSDDSAWTTVFSGTVSGGTFTVDANGVVYAIRILSGAYVIDRYYSNSKLTYSTGIASATATVYGLTAVQSGVIISSFRIRADLVGVGTSAQSTAAIFTHTPSTTSLQYADATAVYATSTTLGPTQVHQVSPGTVVWAASYNATTGATNAYMLTGL